MIGPIRNHPIVLFKDFLKMVLFTIVFLFSIWAVISEVKDEFGSAGLIVGALVIVGIIAAVFLILIRVWMKTTFVFNDTEIVTEKDTVFKKKTTIPYSKLASINVVRTVLDRIVGTSTIQFNVNSGVNAARPEAVLVVKSEISDRIQNYVNFKMTGVSALTFDENDEIVKPQSLVRYTAFDIVFHSLFSTPTLSLITSFVLFIYSVYGTFGPSDAATGTLVTILLFIANLLIPVISKIIRFFGFSVYRRGDRIYMDHGMIRKYHSEFDMARINSVKIVKPLIPRLFGKCYLQADVVGINAVDGDITPTVCLMSSEKVINHIMRELFPEFIYEGETLKQPSEAKVPIYIGSIICIIITAIISVNLLLWVNGIYDFSFVVESGMLALTDALIIIFSVLLTVLFVFRGCISLRAKDLTFGEDRFTITNGVVDRCVAVIQYDRVQAVYMRAGPLARRYSISKCRVSLLSSAGGSQIGSGYFHVTDLERISDTMLRRISDGSYDYRGTEI